MVQDIVRMSGKHASSAMVVVSFVIYVAKHLKRQDIIYAISVKRPSKKVKLKEPL